VDLLYLNTLAVTSESYFLASFDCRTTHSIKYFPAKSILS